MTTNVFQQVQDAVATTLSLPTESITPTSSAESIDAWDSLGQVNIMMALEQTFDIQLEVEDFLKLNSVNAIVRYLEEHSAA